MKISEVKREFQLQQWRGMVQKRKESGLPVKEWCAGCGISEHVCLEMVHKSRKSHDELFLASGNMPLFLRVSLKYWT